MTTSGVVGHVHFFASVTASSYTGYGGGLTVELLDAAGRVVATTSSNSYSNFSFTDVAAGTYALQYVLPDGLILLPGSSGVSAGTSRTAVFTLAAGANYDATPVEVAPVASFTGQVLLAGSGEAGAVVDLLDSAGMLVATASTDSDGVFTFSDVAPGSYAVRYVPPSGQGLVAGGPASTADGITGQYTVTQGQVETVPSQSLAVGAAAPIDPVLAQPESLTFDDEFNSFVSTPDGSVGWMTTYPYAGETQRALPANGEAEYYADPSVGSDPFSVRNGVLDITATVAPAGSNPYGLPYISGLITSYKSLAQTYGYFEARVELPAGQGLWPAFWLLPDTVAYASELDIFEVLGSAPGVLYFTLHAEVNGVWSATTQTIDVADTSSGFHTYGVDWEPVTTTLYIDGNAVASQPTPAAMDVPMYMLLNLAVGAPGSWPGAPASSSEFPATYQIDYVRAYASANTVGVTGTAAILTAAVSGSVLLGSAEVAGVGVNLVNALGTVIATTTTAADGSYSFAQLAAGVYQIGFTAPAGMVLQSGSQADTATGLTSRFTLTDGQTQTLAAETLGQIGNSLSGTVVYGGAGQAGVVVQLLAADGSVVRTVTTGSDGVYSFPLPAAGTYQLHFAAPAGEMLQFGGLADLLTGLTVPIAVGTGQDISMARETLVALTPTLTGEVLADGAGRAGLSLSLESAAGEIVASTTTDAAGEFAFTGLSAGSYQVQYSAPAGTMLEAGGPADNATGLTQPIILQAGQIDTLAAETLQTAPSWIDGHCLLLDVQAQWGVIGDGGVDVALLDATNHMVATTVADQTGWYAFYGIAVGNYQVRYTAPSGQTIAPGTLVDPASGLTPAFAVLGGALSVAPTVYLNGPATICGNVSGAVTVTVTLYDESGTVLAVATTDAAGHYGFSGLGAGSYQLGFTAPPGDVVQTGGPANPATGLTGTLTVAAGQTLNLAPEQVLSNPASIEGGVAHFGGVTDPAWGGPDAGATVTLLDTAGDVLATTVSDGNGWYVFRDIGVGTYQVAYTPPAGQVIKPGTYGTVSVTVGTPAGQTVWAAFGDMMSGFTMTGSGASVVQGDGSYIVTGTASNASLTLGNGNQSVTLSGTGNSITVGTGTNIINAGSGGDTMHAAGGYTTISATSGGNLFDAGAGVGFFNADGSAGNVFMLNDPGSMLMTTITGFNPSAQDVLDLHRTLAGTAILANLSNVGSFVTAATSGANTILSEATPGGTPQAFAVLTGVHTTVAQLLAGQNFSLT